MKNRKPLLSPDAAALIYGDKATPAAAPSAEEKPIRFTVDLPEPLHRRLKVAAMDRRQPMTKAAIAALTEWLDNLST
jgi:hypothetical protein